MKATIHDAASLSQYVIQYIQKHSHNVDVLTRAIREMQIVVKTYSAQNCSVEVEIEW